MDQILEISGEPCKLITLDEFYLTRHSEADGDLRCQAGARWEDINSVLKERGIPLFFPVSIL